MEWRIDRIEGETAVVETEDGTRFELPVSALDENAAECAVYLVSYSPEQTRVRRAALLRRVHSLFARTKPQEKQ